MSSKSGGEVIDFGGDDTELMIHAFEDVIVGFTMFIV